MLTEQSTKISDLDKGVAVNSKQIELITKGNVPNQCQMYVWHSARMTFGDYKRRKSKMYRCFKFYYKWSLKVVGTDPLSARINRADKALPQEDSYGLVDLLVKCFPDCFAPNPQSFQNEQTQTVSI